MTDNDTGYAPPPPGYHPPPAGAQSSRRAPLRRTTGSDNVVGGVAAGVARWLGIDPILVRVAFVILTIIGGSGLLLYLAGWLFIPQDGRADSAGERFFRDNNALAVTAAVVVGLLVISPMLAWGMWDGGIGFGGVVLLLLVVAGVFALTRRDGASVQTATATTTQPQAPITPPPPMAASSATTTEITHPTTPLPPMPPTPPDAPPEPSLPPVPPAPPREKSVLGRLTVGAAMLVAGTLVALDVADVINVDAVTVVASALGTVAVGLLVGTLVGRSRGLIVLGIGLVLALIPLSAVPDGIDWNTDAGTGDRTYHVQTSSDLNTEYALGAGTLTLDLRRVDVIGPHTVDASVGAGEVVVLLPFEDVPVTVNADVAVGAIDMPGEAERGGVDVESTWTRPGMEPSTSASSIDLNLSAGLGSVTVIDQGVDQR
jgi:phage shock protein PspC (stress-responsive transcriptional regulator)